MSRAHSSGAWSKPKEAALSHLRPWFRQYADAATDHGVSSAARSGPACVLVPGGLQFSAGAVVRGIPRKFNGQQRERTIDNHVRLEISVTPTQTDTAVRT